jgi:hypothetical protein
MPEKATLEEMAEACQRSADDVMNGIKVNETMFPDRPPAAKDYRRYQALESAAQVFRIGALDEAAFRACLASLMKRCRQ